MLRLLSKNALLLGPVILAASLFASRASPQIVSENVPKQVDLVVDGDRLVASNVRFSRFDELKLGAQERIRDNEVGEAVIIVVTNQRILAYGVVSGWRSLNRVANEQIESVMAEDFGGLVVTSERLLNFNGQSGVWGERKRGVRR